MTQEEDIETQPSLYRLSLPVSRGIGGWNSYNFRM